MPADTYSDITVTETRRPVLSPEELQLIRRSPALENRAEFMELAEAVCAEFGTTFKAVLSHSRGKRDAGARGMICLLAHRRGFSYPDIGKYMGRDH